MELGYGWIGIYFSVGTVLVCAYLAHRAIRESRDGTVRRGAGGDRVGEPEAGAADQREGWIPEPDSWSPEEDTGWKPDGEDGWSPDESGQSGGGTSVG